MRGDHELIAQPHQLAVPRMRSLPRVCTLVQTAAVLPWAVANTCTVVQIHALWLVWGGYTSKDQRKHLEPGYKKDLHPALVSWVKDYEIAEVLENNIPLPANQDERIIPITHQV